jgi:transposase-like protein
MNLIDVTKQFATDEQCLAYLEQMRWPNGVRCVTCGNDKISTITRQSRKDNKRTTIYQCLEPTCNQQFSATSGTIFHDSHLPLTKWFMAVALVVDAKKGISANQLKQHLGIGSYRTAWFMAHRIRKAMVETGNPLGGTVEIDETYIGGRRRAKGIRGRGGNKDVVMGLRQRGGPLKFVHVKDVKAATIQEVVEKHVSDDVELIMTDDFSSYPFALRKYSGRHRRINHSAGYYVAADGVHTNTIESAFSLLKRGVIGSFHAVSIKHLHRYLSEFEYRFNARKDDFRFQRTVARMCGTTPMQYRELTADGV